jgi:hypothetical protein
VHVNVTLHNCQFVAMLVRVSNFDERHVASNVQSNSFYRALITVCFI